MDGIRSSNVPPGDLLGEFIGHEIVGETRSLRRFSSATVLGPIEASIEDLRTTFAPVLIKATWSGLAALDGVVAGQRAEVTSDAGTHTDPVLGGTVANSGLYSWSVIPEGWQRVADRNTADSVHALVAGTGSIASAGAVDLATTTVGTVTISGDGEIATLGIVTAGETRRLRCADNPVFLHGPGLRLPNGEDIVARPGDVFDFLSEGANVWVLVGCALASGRALASHLPNWLDRMFADRPLFQRNEARGRYWYRDRAYLTAADFAEAANVADNVLNVGPFALAQIFSSDFADDAGGFVPSRSGVLSVAAGRLRIVNGGVDFGSAKFALATKAGAYYRMDFRIAKVTGDGGKSIIRDSDDPDTGTVIAQTSNHTSTAAANYSFAAFIATSGLTWITFSNLNNVAGHSIDVDAVQIFRYDAFGLVPYGVAPLFAADFRDGLGDWRSSRGGVVSPSLGRWLRCTNAVTDNGAAKLPIKTTPGLGYRVDYTCRKVSGSGVALVVRDGDDAELGTLLVQGPSITSTAAQRNSTVFDATGDLSWITFAHAGAGVGDAFEITDIEVHPVPAIAPGDGGRVLVEAVSAGASFDQTLWQIDDGTETNRVRVIWSGGNMIAQMTSGGTDYALVTLGAVALSTLFRVEVIWTTNGFFARLNEGFWEGDAVNTLPVNAHLVRQGVGSGGLTPWFGQIRNETYWPGYGFIHQDHTYRSSIDPAYDALRIQLTYPAGGEELPILIVMHGFAESIESFGNSRLPAGRYAAAGFFVALVNLRGGDDTTQSDAGGREVYDIADAIDYIRRNFPQASKTRAFIAGYSGGGGTALSCAMRFPDLFAGYADHFGISDYAAWYSGGFENADLDIRVGGSPATYPDRYRARKTVEGVPTNLLGARLWIFHDASDPSVPVAHSDDLVAAMISAGNDRYSYSRTDSGDTIRWAHGLPTVAVPVRYTEKIWIEGFRQMPAWTYPRQGTVRVHGWLRTAHFEVRLGDMNDATATLTFNVDDGTYQLTPVAPTTITDVIITQGGKSAADASITGATTLTVA